MLLERNFSDILKLLEFKKGKIKAFLDTDTYNEIDDQFALVQMLFSKEKIEVQSINAAPFSMNNRSDNPNFVFIKENIGSFFTTEINFQNMDRHMTLRLWNVKGFISVGTLKGMEMKGYDYFI